MDLPMGRMPGAASRWAMFFRSSVSVDTAYLLTVEGNASVELGVGSYPVYVERRRAPAHQSSEQFAPREPPSALHAGERQACSWRRGHSREQYFPAHRRGGTGPAGEYRQAVCAARATLAAPRDLGRQLTN